MKKHLQKYLFEEKVCNLVTEISSKETGGIPEPNTNVILKRKIIEQTEEDFSYQPILRKEKWDKERNRVILTVAPDEIPLTRRWLFWRHKTVRGLRVGDSEERYLDLYGSPSVRDGTIDDLLHVRVENGVVTAIVMGHYD